MNWCHLLVKILLIVGGLNWGLVGVGMLVGSGNWNVVEMILGGFPWLLSIVYLLVGVAAVVKIFGCGCRNNCCSSSSSAENTPGM